MLLQNSESLVLANHRRGQTTCPLHVSLHFNSGQLEKITLIKGERFFLHFIGAPKDSAVVEWFAGYLRGEMSFFPLPLEAKVGPFTKKVLEELKKIPMGQTLSYQDVARNLGNLKAARAIGNACNANPFPLVIPCHRVVKTGGQLGGFAYGCEMKQLLLNHEISSEQEAL